jgi:hypothetical protein
MVALFTSQSLTSVSFDLGSPLSQFGWRAFSESGLESIHLLGSIEVIPECGFRLCRSLGSLISDEDFKLSRIGICAFDSVGFSSCLLLSGLFFISGIGFDRSEHRSVHILNRLDSSIWFPCVLLTVVSYQFVFPDRLKSSATAVFAIVTVAYGHRFRCFARRFKFEVSQFSQE